MWWWKKKKKEERPLVERSFSWEMLPTDPAVYRPLIKENERDPYAIAAFSVIAFALYALDPETAFAMLSLLKAPAPLPLAERRFIADRLDYGKDYKPYSFFVGATPQNNYRPDLPYVLKVSEQKESFSDAGYATLYLHSSGASVPRKVRLRQREDGSWALWEEFLLADMIAPKKDNPWA
jgi:hypothetical protein